MGGQTKYITTTLPYINGLPHIGHAYEFVLADVLAEFYRQKLGRGNVFFNVGVDEHGQKVAEAAAKRLSTPMEYCNKMAAEWKAFCKELSIDYDNFYRTTSIEHVQGVLNYFNEIERYTERRDYTGEYCLGCEAFITKAEAENGCCAIHKTPLVSRSENNIFFKLSSFAHKIENRLIDASLTNELNQIMSDHFDLSITRQNVDWGILTGENDGSVFYVWFDALLNYILAIKYGTDTDYFERMWKNSLIICGKDNLKFQAYILQALLIANRLPQTGGILVHGMINDAQGNKMSKSTGNVISPKDQMVKYGTDALRYYLFFGTNTFSDSKYSEDDLKALWNADVVAGIGNVIARLLHIINMQSVDIVSLDLLPVAMQEDIAISCIHIDEAFEQNDFKEVRNLLFGVIGNINKQIQELRVYAPDCPDKELHLNRLYHQLNAIVPYFSFILKGSAFALKSAMADKKKAILFEKLL